MFYWYVLSILRANWFVGQWSIESKILITFFCDYCRLFHCYFLFFIFVLFLAVCNWIFFKIYDKIMWYQRIWSQAGLYCCTDYTVLLNMGDISLLLWSSYIVWDGIEECSRSYSTLFGRMSSSCGTMRTYFTINRCLAQIMNC